MKLVFYFDVDQFTTEQNPPKVYVTNAPVKQPDVTRYKAEIDIYDPEQFYDRKVRATAKKA